MKKIIILTVLLGVIATAVLTIGQKAGAQPCPGQDPSTCTVYGDSRDLWLAGMKFGSHAGDTAEWWTNNNPPANEQPDHPEYACSNLADDDIDGKIDYGNGPGNDTGCLSITDDDESNSPPEPPAPPAPPPPPPGAPPPPAMDLSQPQFSGTLHLGQQGSPNTYIQCPYWGYSGVDLRVYPSVLRYRGRVTVVCDAPIAQIILTVVLERRNVSHNTPWQPLRSVSHVYPETGAGVVSAGLGQSRRCLYTGLRWEWKAEILVHVLGFDGAIDDSNAYTVVWPYDRSGYNCK